MSQLQPMTERQYHDMEMAEYRSVFRSHEAKLNKLNVAELRVLLVHFKFADAGRDARSWSKAEMVEAIAEHMTEDEV